MSKLSTKAVAVALLLTTVSGSLATSTSATAGEFYRSAPRHHGGHGGHRGFGGGGLASGIGIGLGVGLLTSAIAASAAQREYDPARDMAYDQYGRPIYGRPGGVVVVAPNDCPHSYEHYWDQYVSNGTKLFQPNGWLELAARNGDEPSIVRAAAHAQDQYEKAKRCLRALTGRTPKTFDNAERRARAVAAEQARDRQVRTAWRAMMEDEAKANAERRAERAARPR